MCTASWERVDSHPPPFYHTEWREVAEAPSLCLWSELSKCSNNARSRYLSEQICGWILQGFFGGIFGSFSLEKQEEEIRAKINSKIQIRIWEFCGQIPHCKDSALDSSWSPANGIAAQDTMCNHCSLRDCSTTTLGNVPPASAALSASALPRWRGEAKYVREPNVHFRARAG